MDWNAASLAEQMILFTTRMEASFIQIFGTPQPTSCTWCEDENRILAHRIKDPALVLLKRTRTRHISCEALEKAIEGFERPNKLCEVIRAQR